MKNRRARPGHRGSGRFLVPPAGPVPPDLCQHEWVPVIGFYVNDDAWTALATGDDGKGRPGLRWHIWYGPQFWVATHMGCTECSTVRCAPKEELTAAMARMVLGV